MQVPKAKYTVGDHLVLVIKWAETLSDSYHYFGTVTKVELSPDSAVASAVGDGEVPIFYTLSNFAALPKLMPGEDELNLTVSEGRIKVIETILKDVLGSTSILTRKFDDVESLNATALHYLSN